MAELKEARVPDIGDDKDVPVIEVLVKPGDTVSKDQGLVTLESDKATMEVEAVDEGEVLEILVAEGSENVKVNTPIARLAGEEVSALKPGRLARLAAWWTTRG